MQRGSACRCKTHCDNVQRLAGARTQVFLESDGKEADARVVAARLERTVLGQVAKRIKIVTKPLVGKMGAYVQARAAQPGHPAAPASPAHLWGDCVCAVQCRAPSVIPAAGVSMLRTHRSFDKPRRAQRSSVRKTPARPALHLCILHHLAHALQLSSL